MSEYSVSCRALGVALLVTSTCFSPLSVAASQNGEAVAQIGFGSNISDAEIASILDRKSVASRAVFMWSAGFSGTYRSYDSRSTDELLRNARQQATTLFQNASNTNRERIASFIAENEEAKVLDSDADLSKARSLLNTQSQIEQALGAASSDKSLVFAIEVAGNQSTIDQFRNMRQVKAFEQVADERSQQDVDRRHRAVKPAAYNAEVRDSRVQEIRPDRLYALMRATAETNQPFEQLLSEVENETP